MRAFLPTPRFNVVEMALVVSGLIVPLSITIGSSLGRLDSLGEAMRASPLADVQLTERGPWLRDEQLYRQRYTLTTDWFSANVPVWQTALEEFKGAPDVRYLEVGLFEGRSALWMLENVLTHPTSRLVGVDIFEGSLKARYLANLERSGQADRAETIVEPSQTALRKLPLESFNIIYIDGSHAEDDVLEDAVLSFRLLKPGGILIFDDYRWARAVSTDSPGNQTDFAKASIDRFATAFHDHFDTVHNGYQVILRKR